MSAPKKPTRLQLADRVRRRTQAWSNDHLIHWPKDVQLIEDVNALLAALREADAEIKRLDKDLRTAMGYAEQACRSAEVLLVIDSLRRRSTKAAA